MFKKILISNRGEIAVRIIRACRELGISTVAVYSEADRDSLHVLWSDEAYCIGPPPSTNSYLRIKNIISAALITGADAIHPGYGFLSENADFADVCSSYGITFIGPTVKSIQLMGSKALARETMINSGVPVVPGSKGSFNELGEARRLANEFGYPVIIKASAGGGGRGMRIANSQEELESAINLAKSEALKSFANDEVYLEKYIVESRHIEFQILGDKYGNLVHLGERDCSVQRRNQKLIEEAPSIALDKDLRARMGSVAVAAARAVDYQNAGTVEFLLDKDNNYYFMEMNTRIQVEHPVTEMVCGVDLVKEQIKIASGEKLSLTQEQISMSGHAIECRINAEDPSREFMPSSGLITGYLAPGGPGVRVDGLIYEGCLISPYYDSMLAKLIVWGVDRNEAIARMQRALKEFTIKGVQTTIPFHLKVLNNDYFRRGEVYTNFIQRRMVDV